MRTPSEAQCLGQPAPAATAPAAPPAAVATGARAGGRLDPRRTGEAALTGGDGQPAGSGEPPGARALALPMYSISETDIHDSGAVLQRLWADNLDVRGSLDTKLRWFYCDGPHGRGRALVLRAHDAAVGCAGFGVRTLVQRGAPLRAALFADLAIDRRHRSGLPALTLLRSIRDEVTRDFDLGYGFPNGKAIAVYRRAGFVELGRMFRYVRVLHCGHYLAAAGPQLRVAAAADHALAAIERLHALRARRFELDWPVRFDARFDRLWQAVRTADRIACERSAAFLGWRFAHEPHRIAAVLHRDTGALAAYGVLRPADHGLIDLVDLFGASARDIDMALALIVPAARQLGSAAIGFRFLGDPRVIRVLRAHGFVRRGEPRSIVVAPGRDRALAAQPAAAWYLTDLDEDT